MRVRWPFIITLRKQDNSHKVVSSFGPEASAQSQHFVLQPPVILIGDVQCY